MAEQVRRANVLHAHTGNGSLVEHSMGQRVVSGTFGHSVPVPVRVWDGKFCFCFVESPEMRLEEKKLTETRYEMNIN